MNGVSVQSGVSVHGFGCVTAGQIGNAGAILAERPVNRIMFALDATYREPMRARNIRRNCSVPAIGIAVTSALLGCTSIPQDKQLAPPLQPEADLATIHVHSRYEKGIGVNLVGILPLPARVLNNDTWIHEFDGQFISQASGEIRVSGGRHSVKLFYRQEGRLQLCGIFDCFGVGSGNASDFTIDFVAKAGHQYRFLAYIELTRN